MGDSTMPASAAVQRSDHALEPLAPGPGSKVAAVAADAILACLCYLAAYRLRFATPDLAHFLPFALRTLPLVAGAQVAALLAVNPYAYVQGRRWLPRVLGGVAIGTTAGAALTWTIHGFEGVSRSSFAVDALLLILTMFSWRVIYGVTRLTRAAREDQGGHALDDRTALPTVSAGLIGIVRYRELLRNLVLKDLKLKYRGSVFGFVWSLANPLLMLAVYTIAFMYILQLRAEGFVFVLLLGLLNWSFFSSSALMSTGSVVDAGGFIKSVAFPRAILPVATVLFNLAQFLLTIAVFLPIAVAIYHVPLTPAMLLFPVLLLLQVLFTTGVALALSTATVFFRDVRHMLEIGLSFAFWTTPILYQYDKVPEALRLAVLLSPLSPFVVAYQQIFYLGRAPDAAVLLAALSYSTGMFVLGASLFVTYEDQLAERI